MTFVPVKEQQDAFEEWEQGWQQIILVLLDLIKDIFPKNSGKPKKDFSISFAFYKNGR